MAKRQDLTGQRFGLLVVQSMEPATPNTESRWSCLCDCGTYAVRYTTSLRRGSPSCGCQKGARISKKVRRGRWTNTPTYRSWMKMKYRCLNPASTGFANYGGRGIAICERWKNSYALFLADMGERPLGKTIDRIDNDRGYEPNNCRWATKREQIANRRVNILDEAAAMQIRWLFVDGNVSRKEISNAFGISLNCLSSVLTYRNWRPDGMPPPVRKPRRASADDASDSSPRLRPSTVP